MGPVNHNSLFVTACNMRCRAWHHSATTPLNLCSLKKKGPESRALVSELLQQISWPGAAGRRGFQYARHPRLALPRHHIR
jgi:hypothetical protein